MLVNISLGLKSIALTISTITTAVENPRLRLEKYNRIDFAIISLSSIEYAKDCFDLTYV